MSVVDELDDNKTRTDIAGNNAREALRVLEQLPENVTIEPNNISMEILKKSDIKVQGAEARILAVASNYHKQTPTQLVTKNPTMSLKAKMLGIPVVTPGEEIADYGWETINIKNSTNKQIWERTGTHINLPEELTDYPPNTYFVLTCGKDNHLGKLAKNKLKILDRHPKPAWGVKPKSAQQVFAIDALTDPNLPLVSLIGGAGVGKTFLSIAAGLEQVMEQPSTYDRLTILRPVISVGRADLGFLPGDLQEKLGPWFEVVIDTMVALGNNSHRECRAQLQLWVETEKITLESVTFLRGRSLQNTYLIADEVQNLETSTVKTILSRMGTNSKCVLIGDITQIDNPWTSPKDNGLVAAVRAFYPTEQAAHVELIKGERSTLADMAAKLL